MKRIARRLSPFLLTLLAASGAARGQGNRTDDSPAARPEAGGGAASAAARPALRALRVEQVTSGIPDPRPGQPSRRVRQTLTVSVSGEQLLLEQYGERAESGSPRLESIHVLRLDRDPPVIWQFSPDRATYREFRGDLNKHQRDRDVHEKGLLDFARTLPRRQRQKVLADHYLRADGYREVIVRRGERQKILGRDCERVVVTENGRQIVDVYVSVAEELAGGRSFFDLYRRLGAFSTEVLEKLKDIKGLPLKGSITVVTKLPAYKLDIEVEKIEQVKVDPALFRVAGARKIENTPAVLRCAECGRDVETDASDKWRWKGQLLHFCGSPCKKKHIRARVKGPASSGKRGDPKSD
ncbi:MAG: hypothetical protein O7J95_16350 [Planctomycetota bacterium]|nr:hypothetical protein [Planctomycetota bacterium]